MRFSPERQQEKAVNETQSPSTWSFLDTLRQPQRLLPTLAIAGAIALAASVLPQNALAQTPAKKPNILVIMADDVGIWNISAYHQGMMGGRTPNIDRIAKEGARFTDYYAQQSCTAGRASFITGQHPFRTGLLKVGLPGAKQGLQEGSHHRRVAQAARLRHGADRQEPPGRPQ
jgi:Sulfatase